MAIRSTQTVCANAAEYVNCYLRSKCEWVALAYSCCIGNDCWSNSSLRCLSCGRDIYNYWHSVTCV